ncbi:MAG: TldD/PmbA family protein [Candidatus Hodarchaeales archaeon]|jgi:TldD protein
MTYSHDLAEWSIDFTRDNGVNYAEARVFEGEKTSFFLRNGTLISGANTPWIGIGFRVLFNGGLGFCSIDQLSKENTEKALNTAIKMAKVSNPIDKIDFGEAVTNKASWKVDFKEDLKNIDSEETISLLKEMDKKAEDHLISSRTLIFEKLRYNKYLVTSEDTQIHADMSMLKFIGILTTKGILGTEQRMVDLTRSTGWEGTKTWVEQFENECSTLEKVAQHSTKGLNRGDVADFVISPEIAGIIAHENCGHPSEGDRIMGREGAQAGESYWRDLKIGESKVGSKHVTINEDPTIPGSGGYYIYDDEGVKARNRVLIKEGIINEPLLNREFGVKFGSGSNGSARAENFDREPIIRMANTYFAPGDYKFEELVSDIKKGIYMVSFTEWNIDDRRYQSKYVGQECYLIKNGEITEEMVRRPVLETTTVGLFSSIDGISDKLIFDFPGICGKSDPSQGVPVYAGGGFIRMRDVRLG